MTKTVIIGIDGVPFALMEKFSRDGTMPYFGELRDQGIFRKMHSSIPEISSVSWSSIITGKNPGEHGIYGFTEIIPGTYTLSFPHFGKLQATPFWHRDGSFIIINVPSTYPAAPLQGVLVSGFISPDLEKAIYPPSAMEIFKKFDYKIDVDTKKARKSTDLLFKELNKALESRIKIYDYFTETLSWDVSMLVFTGSDRLEHFLWHAYEDPHHAYHDAFKKFFTTIDEALQHIHGGLAEDDALIMLSDHGMERIESNVNVNCILEEAGMLTRKKEKKRGYNNIQEKTAAFALDPGRIYVNKKGKYPLGSVDSDHEESVVQAIRDTFEALTYKGRKVIKEIYASSDIYHGPQTVYAPDLVLLPQRGFNLKGGILPDTPFDTDTLTGKHTQEDAFLYVSGQYEVPETPSVEDMVPLLNLIMGW
ncbi:MAG: alkaline phosphatase family protein [Theionarchaea archaeon]|nr:alkaline phosphatase family protein [Theionarchaea archaeon]